MSAKQKARSRPPAIAAFSVSILLLNSLPFLWIIYSQVLSSSGGFAAFLATSPPPTSWTFAPALTFPTFLSIPLQLSMSTIPNSYLLVHLLRPPLQPFSFPCLRVDIQLICRQLRQWFQPVLLLHVAFWFWCYFARSSFNLVVFAPPSSPFIHSGWGIISLIFHSHSSPPEFLTLFALNIALPEFHLQFLISILNSSW